LRESNSDIENIPEILQQNWIAILQRKNRKRSNRVSGQVLTGPRGSGPGYFFEQSVLVQAEVSFCALEP